MSELHGTSAIITGASSGIGAAIAHALAGAGVRLVLAARNAAKLEGVIASLGTGAEAIAVATDVGSEEDVRSLVERAHERFGTIDALVNNAGFGLFKSLTEIGTDEFDAVLRTNLRGTFLMMKHVLPHMYARARGTVVTISSVAGRHGFAGGGAYCASKFGLMGLTESAFHEARAHNVRVVTLCPGSVDTPFFDEAHTTAPNRDRILQPEDVAAAVMLALQLPERALIREMDIRPTNPGGR